MDRRCVPHVTLRSIAQNTALDAIFAKHEPLLEKALAAANAALAKIPVALKTRLAGKLGSKQTAQGKKAITDADRRRWILPPTNRDKSVQWSVDPAFAGWYHWEVPFDVDDEWRKPLQDAVTAYRAAWRAKMDDINACIAKSAEQEELVDQPEVERNVVRVSGPFTVEAVQPPEMSLEADGNFDGAPDALDATFGTSAAEPQNIAAYLDLMLRYLKADGVCFLDNKRKKWTRLEPLYESGKASGFHAEGRWVAVGEDDADPSGPPTVGVVIGPQYGPVTAKMLEDLIKPAARRYDDLVVAAFNFTGEAQMLQSENPHPKLTIHFAHIRPDINPGMNGLLKESVTTGSGQLFTVFGQPRVRIDGPDAESQFVVTMQGVDIYDPVKDVVSDSRADKVAAWFLDGDYDGRTFCITHACFPDRSAWEKLAKALNGKSGPIDATRFEALSGTTSLPFPLGKHKTIAVKVIDPRGNEVMSVHRVG